MAKTKFVRLNPVKRFSAFQKHIVIRERHFGDMLHYRYNTQAQM